MRYFIAVVEAGSVSDAARRLHVVQPAVSQRLAALEDEIGVQLLVRTRLGVTATPAGLELYGRARSILKQMSAAEAATRERGGVIGGRVGIGLLRSLSRLLAVPLFRQLQARHPEVVPEIVVGYSADLVEGVNAMRLDLALRVVKPDARPAGSEPIFTESLCLVGSRKLLKGKSAPLGLQDVEGIPLLVSPTQPIHAELQAMGQKQGVPFRLVGSIQSSEAISELCCEGYAATFMSETAARHLLKTHGRKLEMAKLLGFDRTICLYSHPEIPKPPSVQACEAVLLDLLRRECANPVSAERSS